ncbi:MAG TPA: hypothetical protein VHB48_12730, partial [Chitinophagaceae bacterium]|nr:hypothetical protein [Chitinophagaceae bacterium]
LNITLQYTSKMLMRNVPNILNHYAKNNTPPKLIAFGFAVYIRFMQSRVNDNGQHVGNANESSYIINDDKARILHAHFSKASGAELVRAILADETLWGTNLASLFEFADFVSRFYEGIMLADNLKQYMATVL